MPNFNFMFIMKNLCIVLFAILNFGVTYAQSKVNSKNSKQLRIEEYKSISSQHFQFTSKDSDGYNVTKSFTVDKAVLVYEGEKFTGFILKSNGKAEAAFEVEKMMSDNSHGKQFWVDKSEMYFVAITFSSDKLDYRDMNIMFISNINGSILYNFPFDKMQAPEE